MKSLLALLTLAAALAVGACNSGSSGSGAPVTSPATGGSSPVVSSPDGGASSPSAGPSASPY